MPELRSRIFAPTAAATETAEVDFGAFLRRLFLFDGYVLESYQLKELPQLVATFGHGEISALLDSGRLQINCAPVQLGQMEPTGRPAIGLLGFNAFQLADHGEFIDACLGQLEGVAGIDTKQVTALQEKFRVYILDPAHDLGERARSQLNDDLRRNDVILRDAMSMTLREYQRIEMAPEEMSIRIEPIEPLAAGRFRYASNLVDATGISPTDAHVVIRQAAAAVGNMNLTVELMERHEAIAGFQLDELSLYQGRLRRLADQLDPGAQEARFDRVITLSGLPSLDEINPSEVDFGKFLDLIQSDEAQAFRNWLRTIDSASDQDIREQFGGLAERVGAVVHSPGGRFARFGVTTGMGAIPVVGPAISAGVGLLDTFLLSELIPKPGPTAFVSRLYRSLLDS